MMLSNKFRQILYKLNESNANNPANLLIGQEVTINFYKNDKVSNTAKGRVNQITNDSICVKDTDDNSYLFSYNGFNQNENMIEFIGINNPDIKFYV